MYKNYIFDLYGTLTDIKTDEGDPFLWEQMSAIYSAYGAFYSPEELQSRFRELEKSEMDKIGNEHAEPKLRKVFSLLYTEKGVKCGREKAEMTGIVFRALSRKKLKLYDGVKELLGELRERGKGVYLLSNAQTDFTRPEIRMLGIEDYFDGIFISSEEGVKKPSVKFFEKVLKKYSLTAKDCVMIGNDMTADIAGARAVGMDCLYIHTATSPICEDVGATYRVDDGDFTKIKDIIL